LNNILQCTLHQ